MDRRKRLLISAMAGIIAAVVSYAAISDARREADRVKRAAMEQYGGDLTAVCVASREIEPGEKIDEGNTTVTEWASTLLPAGSIEGLSDAVGRTATARIPAHAPLAEAYFEHEEGAVDVPRGMVAVSVASDCEHAVGGAIERGERVDVYAQGDALADKLASAKVIDSNVLSAGGGDVQWVTLAIRPSEVRELLAATSRGMVTLTVPGDDSDQEDEREGGRKHDGDADR